MKSVLISIQPKWVEKIASGEKTIEVRKTRPKIETPFKCYIYCTIGNGVKGDYLIPSGIQCGKVIGEFVCDRIDKYEWFFPFESEDFQHSLPQGQLEKTCLEDYELDEYLGYKAGYGWHISDLKIYDKPKELNEFKRECPTKNQINGDCHFCKYANFTQYSNKPKCNAYLERPSQSWCYVEEENN